MTVDGSLGQLRAVDGGWSREWENSHNRLCHDDACKDGCQANGQLPLRLGPRETDEEGRFGEENLFFIPFVVNYLGMNDESDSESRSRLWISVVWDPPAESEAPTTSTRETCTHFVIALTVDSTRLLELGVPQVLQSVPAKRREALRGPERPSSPVPGSSGGV